MQQVGPVNPLQQAQQTMQHVEKQLRELGKLENNPSDIASGKKIEELKQKITNELNNLKGNVPPKAQDALNKMLNDLKQPDQKVSILDFDAGNVVRALKEGFGPVKEGFGPTEPGHLEPGPVIGPGGQHQVGPGGTPPNILGPGGEQHILGPGGEQPIVGPGGIEPIIGPGGTPPNLLGPGGEERPRRG